MHDTSHYIREWPWINGCHLSKKCYKWHRFVKSDHHTMGKNIFKSGRIHLSYNSKWKLKKKVLKCYPIKAYNWSRYKTCHFCNLYFPQYTKGRLLALTGVQDRCWKFECSLTFPIDLQLPLERTSCKFFRLNLWNGKRLH